MGRLLGFALAGLLGAYAVFQFSGAAYIHAKAVLAQFLLEGAWAGRLRGEESISTRPWPWADTIPVARLQLRRLGVDQVVLAGASGRTLAFGPGHLSGTVLPGEAGHSVVSGHRDTHFRFLQHVMAGDRIRLQSPDGEWHLFEVSGMEVIDARNARFVSSADRPVLTLVTCYPFDTTETGQPWRYVVFARALE